MKGTFLFIACSFAILGFVSSQTCQQQDNCDACTATSGCGWCAATKQCLPGTAHGPNNSTCIGRSWEFGSCTPCQSFGDCRQCLEYDADCFWCATANNGEGGCKAIGFVGCPYTRSCPCNIYADCGSCIDDPSCQWCSEDSACVASNATCSAPQPSFNFTTSCPCFINRDCSSCRTGPNCKWCLSGNCDENCAGGWSNSCENYCQSFGNCETCTSQPGCSWCPQTGQCVDPTTATCAFANSCPNCIAATYCDACIESPYCVWCEDSRSCQQKGTQCLIAYGCESYCNQISDCDTCNTIKGCGWCENEKRCSDSTTATCLLAHTCAAPHCGFSGGSFVGGMALMGGIILILVIGYSFYRWRTGSKITYREMM